jgi:tRNA-modifying protein YgfZ
MAATETETDTDTELLSDRLAAEYVALTESCGLLDRSERGKLVLSGPGAKEFLAGQTTNDIEGLEPGIGCYAAFLTPKGHILGDLRVLNVDGTDLIDANDGSADDSDTPPADASITGEQLLLDTERVVLQALFDMIRRFKIGYDVQLHKRTLERGLLSLIGPDSARVAGVEDEDESHPSDTEAAGPHTADIRAAQARRLPVAEHSNAPVEIDGVAAIAVRTDTGIDLICDAAHTDALARALREHGAVPVSEQAAEIVRVERGRPRYGIDLDETVIPQEAGLNERAVSFTKGCYVGQETVARLYYRGKPNRHLRGLRLSEPIPAGAELRLDERTVGWLTSSLLSPAYGPIGLGLVRREAEPGAHVMVGSDGVSAVVTELPFAPI